MVSNNYHGIYLSMVCSNWGPRISCLASKVSHHLGYQLGWYAYDFCACKPRKMCVCICIYDFIYAYAHGHIQHVDNCIQEVVDGVHVHVNFCACMHVLYVESHFKLMDGNGVVVPSWVGFRNSFIAALALLGAAIASRRHSKLRGPFSIQRHQVWSQTWRKMSQRSRGLVIERGGQKTRHFLMLFPFGRCRVQCHDWWLIPKCLKWLVVSLQLGLVMIYPDWSTLRWWANNLNRKMWSEGKSNCVYVYSVCIYYIMYISRYIYIYYIYTHMSVRVHIYMQRCIHASKHTHVHTYRQLYIHA